MRILPVIAAVTSRLLMHNASLEHGMKSRDSTIGLSRV